MITTRALNDHDRAAWEPLWQGYLAFYRASLPQSQIEANWQRFMAVDVPMYVWGAFEGSDLLGFVHCVMHHTSWSEQETCYLQDLFTVPEARGKGVGRALIAHVCQEAKAFGCYRVYWQTHESNAEAQVLYNKVADRSGFIVYRRDL
jgi:GNAT superfamily N-acetyltransferase